MKILKFLLLVMALFNLRAQQISMNFPKFAGKSYDFIIFQGSEQKTIIQGVIPSDGRFTLSIPKQYLPYKGMSRWLITGTKEGGGLDMFIPGHDFSVSCIVVAPKESDIIYKDNSGNVELNKLYKDQSEIIRRYEAMLLSKNVFRVTEKNYPVFIAEYNRARSDYAKFQRKLGSGYIGHFIPIVNITLGLGTVLYDEEESRGVNICDYITSEMDWEVLYTSGHWSTVIGTWVDIHSRVPKMSDRFVSDFRELGERMKSPVLYTDFVYRVAHYLNEGGHEDYIRSISSIVLASGKVSQYDGSLELYLKYNNEKPQ